MIKRWITPKVEEQAEPTGFDSYDLRLGDIMRGERATLGKSLLDVQRELKIKATYIAAIENADVSAFETQGFIAGYVRSYARYLGMDPDAAYQSFCAEAGFTTAHGLSEAASTTKPARKEYTGDPLANPDASFVPQRESVFAGIEPGAVGSVAVLLALIGVIGYGGWSVMQEIQRVDFAPVEQTAMAMETLPGPITEDLIASNGPEAPEAPVAPTLEALDRLSRPAVLDVPVLVPRDGPIATLDPRAVGVMASASPAAPSAVSASLPPGMVAPGMVSRDAIDSAVAEAQRPTPTSPVVLGAEAPEVVLFATSAAWVRVRAADGTVIFEKVMEPCDRYALPKTETPPTLHTGNAGAVYFAVNGTAVGPAGRNGSVVRDVSMGGEELMAAFEPVASGSEADRVVASISNTDPSFVPPAICGHYVATAWCGSAAQHIRVLSVSSSCCDPTRTGNAFNAASEVET